MTQSEVQSTAEPTLAPGAAARLLRRLEALLGALCVLLLVALLGVVSVSVVLRYGLGGGFLGSDELAVWLNVALVAAGAPLGINSALAMRLDVFTRRLPAWGQGAAALLADAFVLVAGLVLSLGGAEIGRLLGGVSPMLGLPEWIRFALLGAGGGLTLVVLALQRLAERRGLQLLASLGLAVLVYGAGAMLHVASALPPSLVLGLIAIGGVLYSAGVIFHAWQRLRFQNAIWHGFVLLGAACHYTAVMDLVLT